MTSENLGHRYPGCGAMVAEVDPVETISTPRRAARCGYPSDAGLVVHRYQCASDCRSSTFRPFTVHPLRSPGPAPLPEPSPLDLFDPVHAVCSVSSGSTGADCWAMIWAGEMTQHPQMNRATGEGLTPYAQRLGTACAPGKAGSSAGGC